MTRMHRVWRSLFVLLVGGVAAGISRPEPNRLTADTFKDFAFRSIGPGLTSGRISDVAVDPKNPSVWYVAAAVGGLWKTENRGNTFTPIFDTYGSYSLGAVTVDPRDSNVVWLGTGENNNQRSVSFGDGVYKSTDAGATWKRMGLENSEHIQNIVVDPRNSNVVYVTAIGPLWSSGGDRGLYKTTDGGQTWKAVLTISPDTGVTDMVIDPKKPDTIYAAALQRRQSGRAADRRRPGERPVQDDERRRDVDEAEQRAAQPSRWAASVSASTGAIRGSSTRWSPRRKAKAASFGRTMPVRAGSASAKQVADRARAARRGGGETPRGTRARSDDWYRGGDPGYYNEIFVDAHDPETIWSTQTNIDRSTDGGKTWTQVPLPGVHVDHHDIVFDPADPKHYMIAQRRRFVRVVGRVEDVPPLHEPAALAVLSRLNRQREAVLSRLRRRAGQRIDLRSVTHAEPRGHSNQRLDPRRRRRWFPAARGSRGSEHRVRAVTGRRAAAARSANRPEHPDPPERAKYGWRTGAAGGRRRRPPRDRAGRGGGGGQAGGGGRGGGRFGRWQWDAPLIVSPHSARRLYFGGERVYRSDDRGDSWTAISGDLTRQLDATKIPIMGKVWPPDSVAFNQATTTLSTITALDESPLLEGLILAGTDDGLVQITEDGGKTWRKIEQFPGVPGAHVRDRRLRVAARFERRLRHAQQLSARRLQAVCPSEQRSRPDLDVRCRRPSRTIGRLVDRAGRREPEPAVRRSRVRRVLHRRRRLALGAARRAAFRPRRRAISRSSDARAISSSAPSGAVHSSSTITRPFATSPPHALAEEAGCIHCATPTCSRRSARWKRRGAIRRRRIRPTERCSPTASGSLRQATRRWC